jgi:MFS transporter, FHS family, glucose/mannose:H+ symporter
VSGPAEPAAERLSGRAWVALSGAFVLSGLTTVILGPLVPELHERWGLPHSEAAFLFLAQFVASTTGTFLSSRNLRRSLVLGYALVAVGLVALALAGPATAAPAMLLIGLGLGLSVPSTNLVVARSRPEARGAALSWINLLWGLGALGSPLLFAAARGRDPARTVPLLLAVVAGLASLGLARVLPGLAGDRDSDAVPAGRRVGPMVFAFFMAELFLYVGVETSVGGWVVALASQVAPGGGVVALFIGSGFWAAFLSGRALAPLFLRKVTETALARVSLGLAAVGVVLLLLAGSTVTMSVGAALAGFGLAPLFPLIVSALAATTGADRWRGSGTVFASAPLGAAVLPWLTGRLAATTGALQSAFIVPVIATALLAVLFGIDGIVSVGRGAGSTVLTPLPRPAGD